MTNNPQENTFTYTYSAKQQEEIRKIREKYEDPKEDKIEQLKRLDASATNKATMKSLTVGLIGMLIMGTGMSLVLTDLYAILGMTKMTGMILGIGVGLAGMGLASIAYPVYKQTLTKERERIAPEILRLADELMK